MTAFTLGYSDSEDTVVDSLTITFSGPVTPGSILLYKSNGTSMPFEVTTSDDQTYVLSFPSSLSGGYSGNSLPAGHYVVMVNPMAGRMSANEAAFRFEST